MDGITYSNVMTSIQPAVGITKTDPVPAVASEGDKVHEAAESSKVSTYTSAVRKEKYELSYTEEEVIRAIEKANKAIMGPPKKFEYSVHKSTGDIIIKVVNSDTNEVLKELPPEKLLDIVGRIADTAGVIIDEKR